MTLIDITQKAAEKAFEITPYNGLAYGGIVVLLGAFVWLFYKDGEKKDEKIEEANNKLHELSERTLGVIALVEEKLPDPLQGQMIVDRLEELKRMIREINK